jgi:hypothetical protein
MPYNGMQRTKKTEYITLRTWCRKPLRGEGSTDSLYLKKKFGMQECRTGLI